MSKVSSAFLRVSRLNYSNTMMLQIINTHAGKNRLTLTPTTPPAMRMGWNNIAISKCINCLSSPFIGDFWNMSMMNFIKQPANIAHLLIATEWSKLNPKKNSINGVVIPPPPTPAGIENK